LYKQCPTIIKIQPIDIVKWSLSKKENEIRNKLSIEYLGHVSTASPEINIELIACL